ncbi:MAG TPA: EAL domain-containing protein, partial [Steroidobacteraceae bacterium]|nr:EAL domain-containing protein [Steroidobacteraceae bacterium]
HFYVSVNLSAAALRDPELSAYVELALQETEIPPQMLKFELTEGGLIGNPGAMHEVLDGIHRLGIEIMLDDFGTGYSSLSYLQLFPFDYLKIDRPFQNRAGSDQANTAIAAAIIQMAASLGLRSVAELVETQAAARDLKRMGCDYAQGYFYCEPVDAASALEILSDTAITLPFDRPERERSSGAAEDSPTVIIPQESLRMPEPTVAIPADTVTEEMRRRAREESG